MKFSEYVKMREATSYGAPMSKTGMTDPDSWFRKNAGMEINVQLPNGQTAQGTVQELVNKLVKTFTSQYGFSPKAAMKSAIGQVQGYAELQSSSQKQDMFKNDPSAAGMPTPMKGQQ